MPPKAAITGAGLLTSSKPLQPRRPPAKGGGPAEAVPDGGGGSDEASDEEWVDPSASVAPLKAAAAFRRLLR